MNNSPVSTKILVCLLILCATCGLSCRRKTPQPEPSPKPDEKADVKPAEPTASETGQSNIAVTVNGVEITEDRVNEIIEPQLAAMAKQGQERQPEFMEQMKKVLRPQAIEKMIVEQLLDEKAKQAHINITEQDVNNQLEEIAAKHSPPLSVDDFKQKMENFGIPFDKIKEQIQRRMVFEKLLEAEFTNEINVTEEDAKNHYDQNLNRYKTPEQVKASHILIKVDTTDPNSDPNEVKAIARAKAEDLLKQIQAGADFAGLAKANSDCPSAENGGDLGFFDKGKMVPPFEKAAFELEVGQVSDIVETSFGYHIIKVTDHKGASTTTFEQAKDEIMERLKQTRQRELAAKYVKKLQVEANIVYPPGKEPKPNLSAPRRMAPPSQPKPAKPPVDDVNQEQLR